jgi:hypothetical protein
MVSSPDYIHKLNNRPSQIQVADQVQSCLVSEVIGVDSLTEYLPNLSNPSPWLFDSQTVILGRPL